MQVNFGLMLPSVSLLDELLAMHQAGKLRPHVQVHATRQAIYIGDPPGRMHW